MSAVCTPAHSLTLEEFLTRTNGSSRVRLFTQRHYDEFIEHVASARMAAKACVPYYWEINGGCVGSSYKYVAYTARCGVFSVPPTPTMEEGWVSVFHDRVRASVSVPCIYSGGKGSYLKWFRSKGGYWFT
jgi:hypothetical protein